jgi:hypothetical protein
MSLEQAILDAVRLRDEAVKKRPFKSVKGNLGGPRHFAVV